MTDFDWTVGEVVVKSVSAIAVYNNGDGDIVIRQEGRDEDPFIVIPKSHAKAVVKAILDAAKG